MSESKPQTSANPWKGLMENAQFRWLFAGNTALFCGFAASVLLRSLLAWQVTGDEMSLAYINLVTAGCMLAMSLVSGTVIDRLERRRLLLIAQFVILGSDALIMGLLLMGNLTFPVLMVSAFAASLTYPYIMPSRTAMLMDAVGRPALGKANAMMGAGVSVARMVSPAVIGLLADLGGTLWAYYLLLFIHLATIFCTFSLNENRSSQHSGESFLNDAKAGFVYMFRHQPLALCILYGLLPTLLVVPLQNLLVVFVDEVWDQGGSGLGILMAAMGMGGLLGSVAMGQIRDDSLAKPMAISTLALAFFVLLFSHSPSFWLATVLMLGIYACSVLCQTLVHTAVQLMTEDSVRGRISTITMMTYGLAPIGTIPLAYGAKRIGAPWAMSIGALLLAVVVVYVWYRVENFRRIDQAAREHR